MNGAVRTLGALIASALLALLMPISAGANPTEWPTAREGRHALIIGVGRYRADPTRPVEPLRGVPRDMTSARTMAGLLQVPGANIVQLQDEQATRERIVAALADLRRRVQPGDRVFIYWSGHGSRFFDPQASACVETLISYDLKDFTYREFAELVKPIGDVADKLFVVYDACHSGGAAAPAARSLAGFRPKTAGVPAQCNVPSNVRWRSFEGAARDAGLGIGDVVHIASSRPDEVSFDHPDIGGLATDSLRRCMQGEAFDVDGSGGVSATELVRCAQRRVEDALRGQPQLLPHHLTIAGNRDFVPSLFAAPRPPRPASEPGRPAPATTVAAAATPAAEPPAEAPIGARDLLTQLHAQRDTKRRVEVHADNAQLRVGSDALSLAVRSSHAGYVYVALAGSDDRSLYLLFPNALDGQHRIEPGQTLLLPRPSWRVVAGGPAGRNRLLVAVTDTPRDLAQLAGSAAGPFMAPLTDADGRHRLHRLLSEPPRTGEACRDRCSDAFGAALIDIEEID